MQINLQINRERSVFFCYVANSMYLCNGIIFVFMIETIIFDMGGVLMQHNLPGCIAKFKALLGDNYYILGMTDRGEAITDQSQDKPAAVHAMHDYEIGGTSTATFIATILPYCKPGTTEADVLDAWITMHGGVPADRIEKVKKLAEKYPVYCLSNNNEAHWADLNAKYPELLACFRQSFLSHQLHLGKPDPRIFEAADRLILEERAALNSSNSSNSYNKANTIFVDDLEANCEAARKHGWQACQSLAELLDILG